MAAGSAGGARTIRPTTVALQWPTIAWGLNVHVTMPSWGRGVPPIDNNPTPSYLSVSFGYSPFAGVFDVKFARKVPHSGAPEASPAAPA
jgi:hypothetical protein